MIKLMAFAQLRENIDEYAKHKTWYWHVPLWLFGLYLFVKLLGFDLIDPQPFALSVMHAFDFMLHEFAHVFTGWLPELATAAAGSASELLLGALLVYGAFQFRNYFAMLFCCLWFMLACMSVGHYMADAIPQAIPLVSLGGAMAGSESTTHDWNFIFGQVGLLESSGLIGWSFKAVGILVGLFGIVFSAWIMYKMATVKEVKPLTPQDLMQLKADAAASRPDQNKSIYPNPIKGSLSDTGARKEDLGSGLGDDINKLNKTQR